MKTEDKIILGAIIFGFVGAVALFFAKSPAIMVSIFLAVGISSLVYRFLGGIPQDSTLTIKTIKLGGTLEALLSTALIFNPILDKQMAINFDELFTPNSDKWVALGIDDCRPVSLTINKIGIKREGKFQRGTNIAPNIDGLRNTSLTLVEVNHAWCIRPSSESPQAFILGKVENNSLFNSSLFNNIDDHASDCYITPKLGPVSKIAGAELEKMRSRSYNFNFSTTLFDQGRGARWMDEPIHHIRGH